MRTINEIIYGSTAGGKCLVTTTPVTGNFYFNPNSFSVVPLMNNPYDQGGNPCFPNLDPVNNSGDRTYGYPRNVERGPHMFNLDIALAKTTAITERFKLEFRAEFFNVLNHVEFASPTFGNGINIGTLTAVGGNKFTDVWQVDLHWQLARGDSAHRTGGVATNVLDVEFHKSVLGRTRLQGLF